MNAICACACKCGHHASLAQWNDDARRFCGCCYGSCATCSHGAL